MWQLGIYLFYYFNGVSIYPLVRRQWGIGKYKFHSMFFSKRLGKLAGKVFFGTPSFNGKFEFNACSQHDSLVHKCFLCSLILKCAWEYFRATHAFTPFSPTPMSFNTTSTFTTLHNELDGYFLFFLKDYDLNQNFKFFSNSFKLTFQCMPHLLASGFSRMVFEHL
jgi:hypothetical protein